MEQSRYQIIRLLGQGQFAKVYLAKDCSTDKLVALKELDSRNFPTRRFLRELTFLVTLQHPNIVSCWAIEHSEHFRYLVMDYCSGGTLRDLMETGNLSLPEKLKLISDILQGLDYAHSKGVIHCDLKPENILLQQSETGYTARLSDFGISRFCGEIQDPNGLGFTGSPAYMAPERFYGKSSYSVDIYGVGVILFELLTGFRPFSGTPGELLSAHLNQLVVFPPTVPFMLQSVILKAMQKLPQKRFTAAAEMLKSITLAAEVSDYIAPLNNREISTT